MDGVTAPIHRLRAWRFFYIVDRWLNVLLDLASSKLHVQMSKIIEGLRDGTRHIRNLLGLVAEHEWSLEIKKSVVFGVDR